MLAIRWWLVACDATAQGLGSTWLLAIVNSVRLLGEVRNEKVAEWYSWYESARSMCVL
jgi:hypothetical protein